MYLQQMQTGTFQIVLGAALIAWGAIAGLSSFASGWGWGGLLLIALGVWSLVAGLNRRSASVRASAQRK
jgi:predicted phage tail protein